MSGNNSKNEEERRKQMEEHRKQMEKYENKKAEEDLRRKNEASNGRIVSSGLRKKITPTSTEIPYKKSRRHSYDARDEGDII